MQFGPEATAMVERLLKKHVDMKDLRMLATFMASPSGKTIAMAFSAELDVQEAKHKQPSPVGDDTHPPKEDAKNVHVPGPRKS